MRHDSYTSHPACPIEAITDIIGGKWIGVIIFHLIEGTQRYSSLQKKIPNISPRMLTKQLKELESSGIVARTSYPTVPPTVEYSLTLLGKKFIPLFESMKILGESYLDTKK